MSIRLISHWVSAFLLTLHSLAVSADFQTLPKDLAARQATQRKMSLEPIYSVAYDRMHKPTSSRIVLIDLNADAFDLCNLRFVFALIKRDYPGRALTVYAYSDRSTLAAMVKFRSNEEAFGIIEFDKTPDGKEALKRRYKEMGYPEKMEGLRAIYHRDERHGRVEQYIDYMPNGQLGGFVTIEF